MKKEKDEILINYEGEPFYNLTNGKWLIDFAPELKKEFLELMCFNEYGKIACCVMAERNMTYDIMRAFWNIDGSPKYMYLRDVFDEREIYQHPYTIEDMKFLFYRMGQLLTLHENDNIPLETKEEAIHVAQILMEFGGIDLIEEKGDIFCYDYNTLKNFHDDYWFEHRTDFFTVERLIKSEKIGRLILVFISKIHWLDDVVS